MKPNQSHVAGLEMALDHWNDGGPAIQFAKLLTDLIDQAKSAPAEVAQGEAVEVVAYVDNGGAMYTAKLLAIMSVSPYGCEPLMTVAQHNRIVAALTAPQHDAELVELLRAVFIDSGFNNLYEPLQDRIDTKLAEVGK